VTIACHHSPPQLGVELLFPVGFYFQVTKYCEKGNLLLYNFQHNDSQLAARIAEFQRIAQSS